MELRGRRHGGERLEPDPRLLRTETGDLLYPAVRGGGARRLGSGAALAGPALLVNQPGKGKFLFFFQIPLAVGGGTELTIGQFAQKRQTFPTK